MGKETKERQKEHGGTAPGRTLTPLMEEAKGEAAEIAAKEIDCQRDDWLRLIPVSFRVAMFASCDN